MRIVQIAQPGGPEQLRSALVEDPSAGPGTVVVEVAAAGVNNADLLQRAGHYPAPAGAPTWPGLEVSGRVVEVGPGAEPWQIGDRVAALLDGGGYASHAVVPVGRLLPV
ncbi:alcohol dehydrogenase catalytic domain-containing protein, partial [Cellulomonas bogoriensis]|uniref:alcohol dehydrogenase catalytic domain-containing protein n=1 Tax=Cellulomonas bogoriensis TaxID=301388 RepID=UPI0012EB6F2A